MKGTFGRSLALIKSTGVLTKTALLIALSLVVEVFTIHLGEILKINFTYLPFSVISAMFGPAIGAIAGAAIDLIGVFTEGKVPFLPLTLIQATVGMVSGYLLYDKRLTLLRCVLVRFIICTVFNTLLNTACISYLTQTDYLTLLSLRAFKNIVLFAFEGVLLYLVLKLVLRVKIN